MMTYFKDSEVPCIRVLISQQMQVRTEAAQKAASLKDRTSINRHNLPEYLGLGLWVQG